MEGTLEDFQSQYSEQSTLKKLDKKDRRQGIYYIYKNRQQDWEKNLWRCMHMWYKKKKNVWEKEFGRYMQIKPSVFICGGTVRQMRWCMSSTRGGRMDFFLGTNRVMWAVLGFNVSLYQKGNSLLYTHTYLHTRTHIYRQETWYKLFLFLSFKRISSTRSTSVFLFVFFFTPPIASPPVPPHPLFF